MEQLIAYIKNINNIVWGPPMILLLMGTHIFFSFKLGFIQKHIFKAIRFSVTPEKNSEGDMSSFATLTTTLAATIGTGNIIGVSTAVALGGPGAIFWCWLTGILGMATSYAECYLGVKFRKRTSDGTYIGGPMYVLENGLHSKFLAIIFCICTLLASYGVGCSTQANSITETTSSLWGLSPLWVGFIIAITIGFAIIGGVQTISRICMKLVPAMGLFYILGCFIILIFNSNYITSAIVLIIKSAFTPTAAAGGIIGSTLKATLRYGIARGLFTNEAGLGSAAIAAAAAKTNQPEKQALVSMSATFWDTVVMCAITGLVIVTNILKFPDSIRNVSNGEFTSAAFSQIPYIGTNMLGISIIAFAAATLLGWCYFGERAAEYLFGKKSINIYRTGYIVMIFLGSVMTLDLVWELSDIINALMAVPNLISLIFLNKLISRNIPKH